LIVESDGAYLEVLRHVLEVYPHVDAVADFRTAYDRISSETIKLLVTNLRLQANVEGLHLAYAVATSGYVTRAVVYGSRAEDWIIHELRRAGAFYESQLRLPFALPSYLKASLPVVDRRNPLAPNRRVTHRGGRRASDVSTAWDQEYPR
jgi:DNA-binding NtrC family response regulator